MSVLLGGFVQHISSYAGEDRSRTDGSTSETGHVRAGRARNSSRRWPVNRLIFFGLAGSTGLTLSVTARADEADSRVRAEIEKRLSDRDLDAVRVEVKNHAVLLS